MINLFYIMLLVFVVSDVYYLTNRKRLSVNFQRKDIMSVRRLDLVYYLLKAISSAWPIIGLFTPFYAGFVAVIILWVLKFVSYHTSSRFYSVYVYAVPVLVSVIYTYVFACWIRC